MKKALIVNYYGDDPKNPGGRRSRLWREIFESEGFNVELLEGKKNKRRSGFLAKALNRLKNLLFSSYPDAYDDWLVDVSKQCRTISPELIILCCPIYDVLRLLDEKLPAVFLVDVRDGIYHESLFTGVERLRYRRQLIQFEEKLKAADILVTNVPGLQRYYQSLTGIDVNLLYNQSTFQNYIYTSREADLKILYAGGLIRSAWGQNIVSVCLAISQLRRDGRAIRLDLVGRFNVLERIFYRLVCPSIRFFPEVSADKLSEMLGNYNCLLMVNTTNRDLLPSKFWLYKNTDASILSISASYSLAYISKEIPGFFDVNNIVDEVYSVLEKKVLAEKFPRENCIIGDEKEKILSILRDKFLCC